MTANTGYAIVQAAYEDAGFVQEGGTVTPDQLLRGLNRLNDYIALCVTQGLKLWLETDTSVPLVVGQKNYSLMLGGDVDMARPLRVKQAYYKDATVNRRPLLVISRDEYTRLAQIDVPGQINSVFVEKLIDRMTVWMWPPPDATCAAGAVHLILHNQPLGIANVGGTTAFPPEWVIALRWGVADEICTGQPAEITTRCAARATAFRTALEDFDVEDTETFFQPDQRGTTASRFR